MTWQAIICDRCPFQKFLNDFYDGDLALIQNALSNVIYMMHFLEENNFQSEEVKDCVFTLERLKHCLHEGYMMKYNG